MWWVADVQLARRLRWVQLVMAGIDKSLGFVDLSTVQVCDDGNANDSNSGGQMITGVSAY